MSAFVFPALLWGLLIVSIPVLIHLINMLRHRRVEWAAMEFLLLSQKKNRTWVVFKQLLLLLLRMAAVAAIVLIVAQPLLQNRFGNLFGSTKTHHIVLLDDSFSMSDRWADRNAFGEAKAVIKQIGAEAVRHRQPQTFTLLRFSRAANPLRPDLLQVPVNSKDFADKLGKTLGELDVSQTSAGPAETVKAIGQLLGETGGQRRIVYLVTDFRAREWDDPSDLKKQLAELNEAEAELHLINCVDQARPNLAITSLGPADGIRASGVEWYMKVGVQNFGTETARNVKVFLEQDGQARPAETIARIPPGRAVSKQFRVYLPTAGEHRVTARLESDAVETDNERYATIDLAAEVPVLIIDNPQARDARFLDMVLSPGGAVRTGISPRIETPAYLSHHPLDEFRSITLTNVERLDPSAVEALEQYVAAGGGVAVFLGEKSSANFYNKELYRDGEGFFPVPLAERMTLLVDRLERIPDLELEAHPIFRNLSGGRNSFVSAVIVQRYFGVPDQWQPDPDSATRVIARLRNGAPLVVQRRFVEGRVLAVLTTAAPVWNNWARNPSFIPAMQQMQAYLSQRATGADSHRVGAKLELTLDPQQYDKQVSFLTPEDDATPAASTDAVPTEDGKLAASFAATQTRGIYQALLTRSKDASVEVRCFSLNVDPAEGDLNALAGPELAERLDGVEYEYRQAASFQYAVSQLAGYNVSEWLLYLLILLLIGEQVLAWSCSYHPPTRPAKAAQGGAR